MFVALRCFVWCGLFAILGSLTHAEEPIADPNVAFMISTVNAYDAKIHGAPVRPLTLLPRPVLKWTNPVSSIEHGTLVLWHDSGRPAVFAQVFKLPEPHHFWLHEGQSVINEPLQFTLPGKTAWSPKASTAEFKVLKKAESPAEKPAARLIQARALARRFTAAEDFRTTPSTPATRFELRLSPQPVYQYTSDKYGVTSGAVFAFVNGTDPEVLLVLEAFNEQEAIGWRALLAPMTCWGVSATFDGDDFWSVEEQYGKTNERDPYFTWRVDNRLVADDPTNAKK